MVNAFDVGHAAPTTDLERFETAASNIEGRPGTRTRLEQLELNAVRAIAEDLRQELDQSNCVPPSDVRHADTTTFRDEH